MSVGEVFTVAEIFTVIYDVATHGHHVTNYHLEVQAHSCADPLRLYSEERKVKSLILWPGVQDLMDENMPSLASLPPQIPVVDKTLIDPNDPTHYLFSVKDRNQWPPYLENIEYRVRERLLLIDDPVFEFAITSTLLLDSVTEFVADLANNEAVIMNPDLSLDIHALMDISLKPPRSRLKILTLYVEPILLRHENAVFACETIHGQHFYYWVPISVIADIFLKEIIHYLICRSVTRQVETIVENALARAPASSYWLFHNYFTRSNKSPQWTENIVIGAKDYINLVNGDNWWVKLLRIFSKKRTRQIISMADTFSRFADTLVKDMEPALGMQLIFASAKTCIGTPLGDCTPDSDRLDCRYACCDFTQGPVLPFLPPQKYLLFFIDYLAQYPIDLSSTSELEQVKEILRVSSKLETKYMLPKLTYIQDEARTMLSINNSSDFPSPTAACDNICHNETGHERTQHICKVTTGTYSEEILDTILTALRGLSCIYHQSCGRVARDRIVGSYKDKSLAFKCWRHGKNQYADFTTCEAREPFHDEDINWFLAFLKCCEYFRDQLQVVDGTRDRSKILSLFVSPSTPQQQHYYILED